jgi:hypothetical protein
MEPESVGERVLLTVGLSDAVGLRDLVRDTCQTVLVTLSDAVSIVLVRSCDGDLVPVFVLENDSEGLPEDVLGNVTVGDAVADLAGRLSLPDQVTVTEKEFERKPVSDWEAVCASDLLIDFALVLE